jgi:small conductance mechanosensitive channel
MRLVTPSDDVVTLPNQHLWTKNVSNSNNGTQTLMCVADFYLHPNHNPLLVHDALHGVALTSPYLHYPKSIKVIVRVAPWSTHYQLKAYPFELRDQFDFISDMTIRGKNAITNVGAKEASMPYANDTTLENM